MRESSRRDTKRILHSVTRRVARLTDTPVVDIYAVDGSTLRALVSFDNGRFDRDWEGTEVVLEDFPVSLKAVSERRVCVAAGLDDPILTDKGRESLSRWRYQSQLSAPLIAGDEVVGLLELSDYEPRDFADHLELVADLAHVAGRALENAAVFEETRRRSAVLHELVDIGHLVAETSDVTTMLRAVVKRLVKILGVADCDVFTLDGDEVLLRASCGRRGLDESVVGNRLPIEDFPGTRRALQTGEITLIADLTDPALAPKERAIADNWGFVSNLTLPLLAEGRPLGFIDIFDTTPRDFAEYVDFLTSLGQIVAGALHKAILLEELEEGNRKLGLLVESGLDFGSTLDLDHVLRSIAERIRDLTGADACDVFGLEGDELVTLMSVDHSGVYEADLGSRYPVAGHSAARIAIAERRAVTIVDAAADPRLTEDERCYWAKLGYPASTRLPLVVRDEVIGLITVFDTQPREFEQRDLLQGLAQTAAQAISNASLLEKAEGRGRVLRELVDLGALIWESRDVEVLTRTVAERLATTIDAASCEIFRLRDGVLTCETSYDCRGGFNEGRVGEQLDNESDYPSTFEALSRLETLVIAGSRDPRLTEEERRVYAEWGYECELVVPLAVEGRLVGMIDVFDTKPRHFDTYLDFMLSVGQMVAGAFENGHLLEQLEDGNRKLGLLVESGLDFGSTLDLDEVLRSIAQRIRGLTDADYCELFAIEGGDLVTLMSVDRDGVFQDNIGQRHPILKGSPAWRAIDTRAPVAVIDAATDPGLTDGEREYWLGLGFPATTRFPLIVRGEVIGLVTLFDSRPRDFGHAELLQGLAQIAAQAVANATLYRRLDRSTTRLEVVNKANAELSSTLSLRSVLLSTAARLSSVGDVQCCDIYLIDDGRLRCVASIKDGEPDPAYEGTSVPLEEWNSARSAIVSRTTQVMGSRDDPRRNQREIDYLAATPWQSQLSVPLIAHDKVIGLVDMFDRRRDRVFSPESVTTVEAVCRSAALAIDNAQLFEQMQARRRETELLNSIARRTTASLDIRDIAEATVEELRQLIPLDRAAMALADDEGRMRTIYSSEDRMRSSEPVAPSPHMRRMMDLVRRKRVVVWDLDAEAPMGAGHPGDEGLRSGASVGLMRDDRLAGILNVGSVRPDAFTPAHRRLLERVGTHLSLAINNAHLYESIKGMHLGNLKALSSALNAKDYYTLGHAARVSAYTVLLGRELGWPDDFLKQVEEAAYLHDIGKIGVPDRVLVKPAGLNEKEWEAMRQHPIFSAEIISPLFDSEFVLGVRHHHEKWDGSGYPDGLVGEAIPVVARAMCVVDSYDAMSFRRPYREARWYSQALEELRACAGTQFDPGMVEAFCGVLAGLKTQRDQARAVAAEAAARIDPEKHARISHPEDEASPEYREIAATLRDVRDAHPGVRFLTTHGRLGTRQYGIVVDAEEDETMRSPIGAEVFADEELPQVFAGREPDVNVLFVDEWGVWISGIAPIRDSSGSTVAVVSADVSPAEADMEGLRSDVARTFSSLVQTTAQRLSREALDAITDGLTGLYNHRYLHERLSEELERAREQNVPLSVLFCDLDQFKAFNDRHGHSAGDAVLRGVGHVLEGAIRHVDLAARYGGEEFVVVLMDTDNDGSVEVAERIRTTVAQSEFVPGLAEPVTVCIGIATFPEDADRKENLIDKADWAMYLAKRQGRDRVMTFAAGMQTATPGQIGYAPGQTHLTLMAQLVDEKDPATERRSENVGALAAAVVRELGLPGLQAEDAFEAARLCDVGMVGLPDEIINKPSRLTREEWAVVRSHALTGERLFRGLGGSDRVAQAIAHHHEHWDGTGYPSALSADDIPVVARVVHAAMAFHAMTDPRPYRSRSSRDEALQELRRCAGTQFDPAIVAALARAVSAEAGVPTPAT